MSKVDIIIKPSEVSANSCEILERLLTKYMDPSAIRVVSGGVKETTGNHNKHRHGK